MLLSNLLRVKDAIELLVHAALRCPEHPHVLGAIATPQQVARATAPLTGRGLDVVRVAAALALVLRAGRGCRRSVLGLLALPVRVGLVRHSREQLQLLGVVLDNLLKLCRGEPPVRLRGQHNVLEPLGLKNVLEAILDAVGGRRAQAHHLKVALGLDKLEAALGALPDHVTCTCALDCSTVSRGRGEGEQVRAMRARRAAKAKAECKGSKRAKRRGTRNERDTHDMVDETRSKVWRSAWDGRRKRDMSRFRIAAMGRHSSPNSPQCLQTSKRRRPASPG